MKVSYCALPAPWQKDSFQPKIWWGWFAWNRWNHIPRSIALRNSFLRKPFNSLPNKILILEQQEHSLVGGELLNGDVMLHWNHNIDWLLVLGPLHGIPIALKDDCDVKGYDSSLGCKCGCLNPKWMDAPVVCILKVRFTWRGDWSTLSLSLYTHSPLFYSFFFYSLLGLFPTAKQMFLGIYYLQNVPIPYLDRLWTQSTRNCLLVVAVEVWLHWLPVVKIMENIHVPWNHLLKILSLHCSHQ